jgi:pimeloyl-ACP methyl ester carboxylesterase
VPVILVHGYFGEPADMAYFEQNLNYSRPVYSLDYAPGDCTLFFGGGCAKGDIKGYASTLSFYVDEVLRNEKARKVDLVVHSMGGLVSRWYAEMIGSQKVRNLVMLGTPNHGSELFYERYRIFLPPLIPLIPLIDVGLGKAGKQMTPHSVFLNRLNLMENGQESINGNVNYWLIGGNRSHLPRKWVLPGEDDGWVSMDSLAITNTNVNGPRKYHLDHGELKENSEVLAYIEGILQGNLPLQPATPETLGKAATENTLQEISLIRGTARQGEENRHNTVLDSVYRAVFTLAFPAGEINFSLITPKGDVLDNSSPFYNSSAYLQTFDIQAPSTGNWTLIVRGHNVSANGTEYSIFTFVETETTLFAGLQKYELLPGEEFYISANFSSPLPVTGASVAAEINLPDGNVTSVALYDDGNHNDSLPDDGLYSNIFSETLRGEYGVTVKAEGNVNGENVTREAYLSFTVDIYPDLATTSINLNYSNRTKEINISATIANLRNSTADNALILFYDGPPGGLESVLLGSATMNFTGLEEKNISFSWDNPSPGIHEVFVMASPYSPFTEEDYSNNQMSDVILVPETSSKPGGSPLIFKKPPSNIFCPPGLCSFF